MWGKGRRSLGLEGWWTDRCGRKWWQASTLTWCFPSFFKVAEAMEINNSGCVSCHLLWMAAGELAGGVSDHGKWLLPVLRINQLRTQGFCFLSDPTGLRATGSVSTWCGGFPNACVCRPKLAFEAFLLFLFSSREHNFELLVFQTLARAWKRQMQIRESES